jgi:hypothetical protein
VYIKIELLNCYFGRFCVSSSSSSSSSFYYYYYYPTTCPRGINLWTDTTHTSGGKIKKYNSQYRPALEQNWGSVCLICRSSERVRRIALCDLWGISKYLEISCIYQVYSGVLAFEEVSYGTQCYQHAPASETHTDRRTFYKWPLPEKLYAIPYKWRLIFVTFLAFGAYTDGRRSVYLCSSLRFVVSKYQQK